MRRSPQQYRENRSRSYGALDLVFQLKTAGLSGDGGRAAFLAGLRERIDEELAQHPDRSPPSLRERYMDWYSESVVPMIVALASEDESVQIVNVESADGLVREVHALVSRGSIARRDRVLALPFRA